MTATLTIHGAAGTVTGSCYRLDVRDKCILIDCGMFQGDKTLKELNYKPWPFEPRQVSAVLLTHAHIDHSGLIPKLAKAGYTGNIYATPETCDLLHFMLPDSGGIQEMEVERLNRRNERRGRKVVFPIYTEQDAVDSLRLLSAREFDVWFEVVPGVRARFWNAGHILGSASIEVEIANPGSPPTRMLFSGDIGPEHKALQDDASAPKEIDVLIMESTYGGRSRPRLDDRQRRAVLAQEVNEALAAGGNLVIPAFAVERTQELLADLVQLFAEKSVRRVPIFIDSPLATHITEVFARHLHKGAAAGASTQFSGSTIRFTRTVQESMQIEQVTGGAIIIAASGMCEAGRIRHHLKNNLWRPNATVLLIGYQAAGTLGALLERGESAVRIQGEDISVRARIRKLDIYSGHADHEELLDWLKERLPVRLGMFLTHGEPEATAALRAAIAQWGNAAPRVLEPKIDEVYAIDARKIRPVKLPPSFKRLDRYAEAEALSGHDWHNDYARLMLLIQQELKDASSDADRRKLLKKMRRLLSQH